MKIRKLLMAITISLLILLSVLMTGCNIATRSFGGTQTIDLPVNTKLVVATWKDTDFWYLVRPMRANESPETYEFIESSTLGIAEGKMILKESR